MSERVTISIENHIADVRFNRADKMNALDKEQFLAILEAQKELAAAEGVRVVVLSGEGRAFCAGLDVTAMMSSASGGDSSDAPAKGLTERTYGNTNLFQEVAMGWRKLPMPVIAAVHGVCFGGGLQLASGADIRVITPDARLSVMEMKWGLVPDMGGFALWRGYVRDDVLRELTYTNREFTGEVALQLGFATHVVSDAHGKAMALAEEIASKHPAAMREAKAIMNQLPDLDEDAILMQESVSQDKVIGTPDQIETVMAQIEKREANYSE